MRLTTGPFAVVLTAVLLVAGLLASLAGCGPHGPYRVRSPSRRFPIPTATHAATKGVPRASFIAEVDAPSEVRAIQALRQASPLVRPIVQ